ncbi:uncharacterized protein JN550_006872 [Neoarthrinium moseri]|uniref:uncharacterized protein n=1 Tax=Neoarthrinium moseri TaxID=1658444 RepID=UPI001FDC297A|nr:uncharacterized protein JN550_006872 [Neoarthrinium moseri]KAI1867731.1 hypothetical protein JN550_006872 [Neoarthrinium moseri]
MRFRSGVLKRPWWMDGIILQVIGKRDDLPNSKLRETISPAPSRAPGSLAYLISLAISRGLPPTAPLADGEGEFTSQDVITCCIGRIARSPDPNGGAASFKSLWRTTHRTPPLVLSQISFPGQWATSSMIDNSQSEDRDAESFGREMFPLIITF